MNGTRNRGLIVLSVASALATIGVIWLGIQLLREGSEWMPVAMASPLALKCLAIMGGGLVLLGLIAVLLLATRRVREPRPKTLHGDQGGAAAIEMTLLFPFALMIFLVIIQTALLFNANMVVHYAAFCAARMATVVMPQSFPQGFPPGDPSAMEPINLMLPDNDASSPKIEAIRRAAVLALVPISAQASASAGAMDSGGANASSQTQSLFQSQSGKDQHWFGRVQAQYSYANANVKVFLSPPAHWCSDGSPKPKGKVPGTWKPGEDKAPDDNGHFETRDPDSSCPYWYYVNDTSTWQGWEYAQIRRCIGKWHNSALQPEWDYWYWEDLYAWLKYQFMLQIPYANRIFADSDLTTSGESGQQYAIMLRVVCALSNEGGQEIIPKN